MEANNKIYVSKLLKDLNEKTKKACKYHKYIEERVNPITCKQLAKYCEVTPATITNLTTSSNFYLIHKVASEILDAYYGYFWYEEDKAREEHPDEIVHPRNIYYIIMLLTNDYTDEWLNY